MCLALKQILTLYSGFCIFIGDFVRDHNYRQLVSCYTTDNRTTIDHIYTNLPESEVKVHIIETYFTDDKGICAFIQTK